jgi:DNA-binding CsgD family transcriptional regulator
MPGVMRTDGPIKSLSPREHEIAGLIAHGMTDREIASHLNLSIRTVEGHIYRARVKLDAPTRHDMARAAWGDLMRLPKPSCRRCGGPADGPPVGFRGSVPSAPSR